MTFRRLVGGCRVLPSRILCDGTELWLPAFYGGVSHASRRDRVDPWARSGALVTRREYDDGDLLGDDGELIGNRLSVIGARVSMSDWKVCVLAAADLSNGMAVPFEMHLRRGTVSSTTWSGGTRRVSDLWRDEAFVVTAMRFFGGCFLSEAGVLGPRDTFVGGFFNGTRRRSLGWLERPSLAMSPEIEADSHGVHPKEEACLLVFFPSTFYSSCAKTWFYVLFHCM